MDPTNIYDLITSDDEGDAKMRAQALAQALGRDRGMGVLGQLTGDRVLGGLGQNMFAGAQRQEAQLADAGQSRLALAMERRKAEAARGKGQADIAEGLRKELLGNDVTKNTQALAEAVSRMQDAYSNPSAAGDISLVFGFMKALDPRSTVRENEQATAENAGGVPSTVRNTWNKIMTGERLPQHVRDDFMTKARGAFAQQYGRYKQFSGEFGRLAREKGVPETDVALDFGFEGLAHPKTGSTGKPAPAEARRAVSKDGKVIGYINPDGSEELVP